MHKLRLLVKSMRPRQWPKNIFIFAALGFDRQILDLGALLRTTGGFVLLCLASGVVYLINDVADRNQDRLHPDKRKRPIAAGEISVALALAVSAVLGPLSVALAFLLNPVLGWLVFGYLLLNLAYSFALKHVPIVDALTVAAGFVIRVAAGVTLIQVERFSPWLYVCTILLALYISFGKRRAELALLVDDASNHRRVLDGYTIPLLDSYIQIVSAATIVAYSLYTFSAPNLPANHSMMLTVPFVVYSIFRYLYLIQVEKAGGAPEEIVMMDRPLQAGVVLWALSAMSILYLQR
ncbi:MAG: phosphoribose diphosphate--decaprenyl-phosphate phosphoribosyltransferase [Chloroflexi bacterium RBG_16_64_43]|nr:MAG: phosphoribose diphosphate--decaprenyl-phosphate phosphoribosyltransferase [Chloroflexi bacterium RBG_16_64_43]